MEAEIGGTTAGGPFGGTQRKYAVNGEEISFVEKFEIRDSGSSDRARS